MRIAHFLPLGLVIACAVSPAAGLADEAIEPPQVLFTIPEQDNDAPEELPRDDDIENKSTRRSASQITTPTIDEQLVRIATEVIQHRYPNGATSISRQVYRNEQGNYVDHGSFKHWDPQGNLIAEGQCDHGVRTGTWVRKHQRTDSPLFATLPFSEFEEPFLSQASFKNGQLDGDWSIQDAKQLQIVKWHYENGTRKGEQSWFYHNGQKMRTIVYVDGTIHGDALLWNTLGKLIRKDIYIHGRREVVERTFFDGSVTPKSQTTLLQPMLVKTSDDDWWNARPATFGPAGEPVKHGPFTTWHANGQRAIKGNYNFNDADGEFTWWYENGQKAIQGTLQNNLSADRWTWWHTNGQRAIEGMYRDGLPTGEWSQWNPDGRIVRRGAVRVDAPVVANQEIEGSTLLDKRY